MTLSRVSSMRLNVLRSSAFWSLLDQCIVSVGNFAVTLLLARLLVPAEYGVYSLLLLLTLALQTVTGSLLFYPLTVRATVAPPEERAVLFGRGMVLLGILCVPLALILAGVLEVLDRPGLAVPAIAWLALSQVKELVRRIFLAEMRYIAAIPGDAVCYLGQAVGIVGFAAIGSLTLAGALGIMAATAALATILQAVTQVRICPTTMGLRQTVQQCWEIGGFSLASNFLSALRAQVFPWALAIVGGTALAAHFQAGQNLVMAPNPILLGLCNVIPQVAARGRQQGGNAQAWYAARGYMLSGALPIIGYYAVLLAWPAGVLGLLYGVSSPYVELTLAVRMMASAALIAYAAEMVCSYLHGLEAAKVAMKVNLYGLMASVVLGLPITFLWGLPGACIGLVAASIVRTALGARVLVPLVQSECPLFSPIAPAGAVGPRITLSRVEP